MKALWFFILAGFTAAFIACAPSHAAEPRTENTFQLSDGEERPAATLEDAAWLAGSWTGTACISGRTFATSCALWALRTPNRLLPITER